jgi:nitrite reductase/ring-hydroxylating ferredoxin subunit
MRQSLSDNILEPVRPDRASERSVVTAGAGTGPTTNPGDAGEGWAKGHVCTRREVLRSAGLATLAAGTGLGLAACGKPGIAVPTADVPVGDGTILADANYVVTQPTAGRYKAFVKSCPHALAPVSSITNGQIVCERHGSRFSINDGSVITGPATRGLGKAKVTVSGDTLTVTA